MATADNRRFLRKWWEVGLDRISADSTDCETSKKSGKKWFPYMKGGPPIAWFGNQEHVVNYGADGYELKAHAVPLYGNSGWSRIIKSTDKYFQRGVTWSLIGSRGFAARLSPGGFVFDVAGMTCFPPEPLIPQTLAILNSTTAKYLLTGLNPTINYQVGDIERLPVPKQRDAQLEANVSKAVEIARARAGFSEISRDFVIPPRRLVTIERAEHELVMLGSEIDAEVSRLYDLSTEDLRLIRDELATVVEITEEVAANAATYDDDDEITTGWSDKTLAQSWISYSFGAVLGRFQIGMPGGLGRGDFPATVVDQIRKLVDADGIMSSDSAHPQDIVRRVLDCVDLMLSGPAVSEAIRAAIEGEGDAEELLRDWIDRQYWKYHFKLYRKRPIYWPLQSPKKRFTIWVFHERLTKDTLFKIRSEFVEPKARWLESRIREFKTLAGISTGRERRAAEKEASQLADELDDVREFAQRLNRIAQRGYAPHTDDGVLLNAAPLWELLPSWTETKKAWRELEAGKYDWAQQAMEYWPERVKEACKANKSFAIAHGLALL